MVGNILLAAEVVVAIQHEDGSRVQGSFSPTTPLWEVVMHLEGGPVGGGPVGGEQTEPVVVYTNQQVYGENSLRQQTLRDVGLSSGRGVIRFGEFTVTVVHLSSCDV